LMLPTTTMGFCIKVQFQLLQHWDDGDQPQAQQEKDKHAGMSLRDVAGSAGRFLPDKSPTPPRPPSRLCRSHRKPPENRQFRTPLADSWRPRE